MRNKILANGTSIGNQRQYGDFMFVIFPGIRISFNYDADIQQQIDNYMKGWFE